MAQCPHYRVEKETLRSNEIRADRMPADVQVIRMPWCAHPKHSPVSKIDATSMGGANLLTCEGDWKNKCPLTRAQFLDI
jgi:hypothetical protein